LGIYSDDILRSNPLYKLADQARSDAPPAMKFIDSNINDNRLGPLAKAEVELMLKGLI
jgi:hypothetical protein